MTDTASHKNASYKWYDTSLVSELTLRSDSDIAYLHASASAQYNDLKEIRQKLQSQGFSTSIATHNNSPVLRISGVEKPESLVALLQENHFVVGEIEKALPSHKPTNIIESIKKNTLYSSSILGMSADVVMTVSGILRVLALQGEARKEQLSQTYNGLMFAAGDVLMLLFARTNEAKQFKKVTQELKEYLEKNNVEIPDDSALSKEGLAKPNGIIAHIIHFFEEHAHTYQMLSEIFGGVLGFVSGKEQKNDFKKVAGIVILAGWALALLIQEKKLDKESEEYKNANDWQKLVMRIQDKPLAVVASMCGVNNLLTIAGTISERNKPETTYKLPATLDAVYSSLFLTSNVFYSMSRKTMGGKLDAEDSLINDVYGLAVDALAKQPEEKRNYAIEKVADFLGGKAEIQDKKADIIAKINAEIEKRNHHLWVDPAVQQKQHAVTLSK